MFKVLLSILLALIIHGAAFAQNNSVKGSVTDTAEKKPLANASIALLRAKDSVLVKFSRALPNGSFEVALPAAGKYIVLISYPGYADHADIVDVNGQLDLEKISMLTKAVLLQNVIVRGSAVRMKGDTMAFVADSFKVREGATVEDLLKKLPGLTVNNKGEITAQGQQVQRVLVDGDEFFGEDPTLATRNLQANAVKEVQVFDRKSDQATFTGVDDGQTQKTINLKLKDEFKRGYFGKVKLAGGLPNRWENQAMINAFKDKRKFSVYGIMANTNNNALGWSEEGQFGGSMNTNMETGDDGSVFFYGGGDEFGGTGGYYGEGIPTSWTLGTSYANKWNENRSNATGAYRFQKLKTEAITSSRQQFILPDTQFFNNQRGENLASRWRHRATGKSEIFVDSSQSFTVSAQGSYGENSIYNRFYSEALSGDGSPVNNSERTTNSLGNVSQFNTSALWKYKFKKQRRTLSVNLNQSFNEANNDGFLFTKNEFFFKGQILTKDTIDQKKINDSRTLTYGGKIAYSEPVGRYGIFEINYGYNFSNSKQERLTFDELNGKYDQLNLLFSNDFKFKNTVHRTGGGYRYNGKKLQFGFGSDVAFNRWRQEDFFRDTVRLYNFTNLFPRATASYKLGQYSRLRFNYNGNMVAPSANQLQPIADNSDPLNIIVGNPNLTQSFNHRLELNYNFWHVLTDRGFWSNIWFNPTDNAFSTRDFVDSVGRKIYQTVNVDGNYNLGAYMQYNFKWKKPDLRVGINFNPGISANTNFVNNLENRTQNNNWGFGFYVGKSKENKFDLFLNQSGNYITSKSSIRPDVITRYWTSETNLNATFELPRKITLTSNIEYLWRQKTPVFPDNNNAFIWNMGVEKKLFKKKDIKLGFRVNDLLNQNLGFRRNVTSNFVSERTYNVIRRFWLLTFNWSFNKGPQKAEEDNW